MFCFFCVFYIVIFVRGELSSHHPSGLWIFTVVHMKAQYKCLIHSFVIIFVFIIQYLYYRHLNFSLIILFCIVVPLMSGLWLQQNDCTDTHTHTRLRPSLQMSGQQMQQIRCLSTAVVAHPVGPVCTHTHTLTCYLVLSGLNLCSHTGSAVWWATGETETRTEHQLV